MKTALACLFTIALAAASLTAAGTPQVRGDYLEVRSCDVYTGYCFANAEIGVAGKEGILVWSVREGRWKGATLDGLKVIAVVRTDNTLGDVRNQPRRGKAVLIVDERADAAQREALADLVRSQSGQLTADVVEVKTARIEAALGVCTKEGCAAVKAGNLVEITTRCLGGKDHICGNEQIYYPPLTEVQQARPAFTEVAAYRGPGLGVTWESTWQRGAYLASFSL